MVGRGARRCGERGHQRSPASPELGAVDRLVLLDRDHCDDSAPPQVGPVGLGGVGLSANTTVGRVRGRPVAPGDAYTLEQRDEPGAIAMLPAV